MTDTFYKKANAHAVPGVYLVGAGPGDPDYLTLKACRLIDQADVIVYDRLVSPEIMDLIPDGVAKINVGKQAGNHCVPQDEINDLLLSLSRDNRCVVRLKGGDPFLFGRGGEESIHLSKNGIHCEVVPGITSASGCAANIGLPLTYRGIASSVRYVTGHMREGQDLDLDWSGLANEDTTLVIYMGAANISTIASELIAHGLPLSTGAAAICNATRPNQQVIVSTVAQLSQDTLDAELDGPVLFIIGNVIELLNSTGKITDKITGKIQEFIQGVDEGNWNSHVA